MYYLSVINNGVEKKDPKMRLYNLQTAKKVRLDYYKHYYEKLKK